MLSMPLNFCNSWGHVVASNFSLICIFLRNDNSEHTKYVYRSFTILFWCAHSSLSLLKKYLFICTSSLNVCMFWVHSEVVQSCPTLCDPVDCSPPGSSIHGILQARILEWVASFFSRGSSWPRDQTQVSCIAGDALTSEPPAKYMEVLNLRT